MLRDAPQTIATIAKGDTLVPSLIAYADVQVLDLSSEQHDALWQQIVEVVRASLSPDRCVSMSLH